MTFPQAVASGFKNYVTSAGRASRSEYWYWVLFMILASIVMKLLDSIIFHVPIDHSYSFHAHNQEYYETHPFHMILIFIIIWPWLAVAVRRLHDINRSGWCIFLGIIPIVGPIILLIWNCTKGTEGENRFGSDPLGA